MSKKEVHYTTYLKETLETLVHPGLLLVSGQEKPNIMTIGWGTIGIIWGKPVFLVLVRPSRFTYGLIEEVGDFTVNVPSKKLEEVVSFCGTVSGRDYDKFREKNLTPLSGKRVKSPTIEECLLHYECKVIHKNDVLPPQLSPEIIPSYYPAGDFHRVYFGEILGVYASENARNRFPINKS